MKLIAKKLRPPPVARGAQRGNQLVSSYAPLWTRLESSLHPKFGFRARTVAPDCGYSDRLDPRAKKTVSAH